MEIVDVYISEIAAEFRTSESGELNFRRIKQVYEKEIRPESLQTVTRYLLSDDSILEKVYEEDGEGGYGYSYYLYKAEESKTSLLPKTAKIIMSLILAFFSGLSMYFAWIRPDICEIFAGLAVLAACLSIIFLNVE